MKKRINLTEQQNIVLVCIQSTISNDGKFLILRFMDNHKMSPYISFFNLLTQKSGNSTSAPDSYIRRLYRLTLGVDVGKGTKSYARNFSGDLIGKKFIGNDLMAYKAHEDTIKVKKLTPLNPIFEGTSWTALGHLIGVKRGPYHRNSTSRPLSTSINNESVLSNVSNEEFCYFDPSPEYVF
ncbi:hypothetical protein [Hydrogenovibrio kuenenii]|uniref:hypothetical protein n=1 Tax=Hydrogenovibrio kuenenii TaxID=63658 RepID=UPI000466C1CB|nr:hypothetical protein [Hydrogenovibrio kuenenii]